MNDLLLAKVASAGSVFLTWHFLTLTLSLTGLLLEKAIRRGNPHVRSTLLRMTLLVALTVPVVCSIWNKLPQISATFFPSLQQRPETPSTPPISSALPAVNWDRVAVWRPMIADLSHLQDNFSTTTQLGLSSIQIFHVILLGTSLLVSFCLLVRLVLAVFHGVALRRRGIPLEASREVRGRIIATAMGSPVPTIREVAGLESPVLLGFWKPTILLPAGMEAGDEIYGHELTHLKRRDMWWHLFARLATILMPLQPGFWLIRKALARADEDVCDDMVLMQGANRSAYAELLLSVAESQHTASPDLCLSMAAVRSKLEHRVRRLMDTARPLADRLSVLSLCIWLSPLLAMTILAGAIYLDAERPLRAAEEKPANILTDEQAKSLGIAAMVNQHRIMKVTVDKNFGETEKLLRQNMSGDELNETIARSRNNVIQALIDRELILEEFKAAGGFIPEKYVDARVDDEVKNRYHGDRKAFLSTLADRHETLESYKQEIQDNAIIQYMRALNVSEKLRTYYQEHLNLFPQDEQINVSVIAIDPSPDKPVSDHSQPSYLLAQQVLDQVRKGADFLTLSKKYKIPEFGPTLWVTKDEPAIFPGVPAGWQAIEKLQPGQTSNLIDAESFYLIARVNERRPAKIAPTDEAIAQKKGLIDAETQLLTQEWLGPLRAAAKIQNFEFPRHGHVSRDE